MWGARARWISFFRPSLRSARSTPPVTRRDFSSGSVQLHSENVGFIGLGNMGFHMAKNLINAGYKLTVHDINHNAVNKFKEMGIATKETPFDIAESSDIVITMLPSSADVLEVYTGRKGLLHGNNTLRPWLFIDSSTVDPLISRTISEEISKRLLKDCMGDSSSPVMLDAPVSGGVPGAESGTLTFMVGGSKEAFMAARPVFQSMGRQTIYCGAAGNGAAAKICNNLAMAVSMVGVSEAFALGQHLGVSATVMTDIFNSSSARCWSSDTYNPVPGVLASVPSSKDYSGGFSSKLMLKDLALAVSSADGVRLGCPLAAKVLEIYAELCESGHETDDFSCVFRHHYSGKDEKGF